MCRYAESLDDPADKGEEMKESMDLKNPFANLPANQAEAGAWHYMARQPILDKQGRVHGYYLLSGNAESSVAPGIGGRTPLSMIDNVMLIGIDQLTHGMHAFLPVGYEAITQGLVEILPAAVTVLHLDEEDPPEPELIKAIRQLQESNFHISVGSHALAPSHEALFHLAHYIKFDPTQMTAQEIEQILKRAARANVTPIANNINTQADFQHASSQGFALFKGYFFCKAELMKNRTAVGGRTTHFKILEMMQRKDINVNELANSVKQDIPLAYRLLRLVNSPVCGIRQQVRSIEAALLIVGEERFRRIATLAVSSDLLNGRPSELLRMSYLRARFCELVSPLFNLDSGEQYLLGLLSLMPAILLIPMEKLAPSLPLQPAACAALCGEMNLERTPLTWLEAHEYGNWALADAITQKHQLTGRNLIDYYMTAAGWAEEVFDASS